jgi:hypothetical protein
MEVVSSKKEYGIDICKEEDGGGRWSVLGTATIITNTYAIVSQEIKNDHSCMQQYSCCE